MSTVYETGALFSGNLPAGQRAYYEQLLLQTLRTKSILVPYTAVKEDFAARATGQIVFSEVMDTAPNTNPLAETDIWLPGAHLDSRSVTIQLEIHGDTIKTSAYNELVNFWNNGDMSGLVKGKLGQNMVDYMDILARNAFLSSPYKTYAGSGNTSRFGLAQTDLFDPDLAGIVRTHLEEKEIPGVSATGDGDGQTIVCVTTPRVIQDIRTGAGSKWLEAQLYQQTGRKFNSEVGSWDGVRFVKTNRLKLFNAGLVTAQGTLNGATVPGQGAAATVDNVYAVGQAGSTRYVTLQNGETALFAIGDVVTIHSEPVAVSDGAGGFGPVDGDGTAETRRIVNIVGGSHQLVFDRPLMKAHASGDYVTKGVDVHASLFMGGPSVVYAIGERPNAFPLAPIDDMAMIHRFSWRAFAKMQMFRPEWLEVVESGGSVN
jgi:N4-gp56 family major capsid protein